MIWKVLREILVLIWKLIRTLIREKLRAILMKVLLYTVMLGAAIAVILWILSRWL